MFKLPEPQGIEKKMVEMISEFWDDEEYILGVRIDLKTDQERQWMIEAIEVGEIKSSDDVILYALQIDNERRTAD